MKVTVGATPQKLDTSDYPDRGSAGQVLIIQNLGPGEVYFDSTDEVTIETGVQIGVKGGYELSEFTPNTPVYFVATQESDLRISVMG